MWCCFVSMYNSFLMSSWSPDSPDFLQQVDVALAAVHRWANRWIPTVQRELQELTAWGDAFFDLKHLGHIAMVDDEPELLLKYIPGLIYATRGAASQILFRNCQSGIHDVRHKIALACPDTVLLDYRLNASGGGPYG